MWKTKQEFYTMTLQTNWRDVAQLGSAFVLGTKCHGFKSCHPYLITAQKSSNEESILDLSFFNKIGHTYNSEFYDIL